MCPVLLTTPGTCCRYYNQRWSPAWENRYRDVTQVILQADGRSEIPVELCFVLMWFRAAFSASYRGRVLLWNIWLSNNYNLFWVFQTLAIREPADVWESTGGVAQAAQSRTEEKTQVHNNRTEPLIAQERSVELQGKLPTCIFMPPPGTS